MGEAEAMPAATTAERRAGFVAVARDLAPVLRGRAHAAEQDRRIADETHRAFLDAGLYRLFQPTRYGGHEMDVGLMVDVAAELGRGCGSSAWIFTNIASQAWINGMKDPRAQEELWADDPDTLVVSASPGPGSSVRRVDGGFVVDGIWNYSSGVDFATWVNLQLFLRPEDGPAEHRFAAVPLSECEIVDDWFVTGLAATGSRSVVLSEAFIPDYRTLSSLDMHGGPTPGSAVNPGVLFRLPFWGVGGKLFAGPALGMARGAVELTETDIETRKSMGGAALWEQPTVHVRIAEAGGEVEAAWAVLLRDSAEATRMTEAGELPALPRRAFWRRNNAYATLLCVRAVDRIIGLSGMRGLAPDSDVQRQWRDVHAAAAQISVAWDVQAANYGRARFGLPFDDPRA